MAINNQPTIKPRTVTGLFTKYIAKVIPLAFDESMSYYECLCALLEYLNETIVPDINNTNDGLRELQEFYIDLQNYVNDYFDSLDVQEEINNKLDEMVEDGELQVLLNNLFNSLRTEVNNKIDTFENITNNNISNLTTLVNSAVSGNPIPVSSTSQMTDTSKTYLLTSDGYWYWYNGSAWIQGGLYQSTGIDKNSINYDMLNQNYSQKLKYTNSPIYYGYKNFEHPFIDWENGGLNNDTGATTSANNCIRTVSAFIYDYSNPLKIINESTSNYRFKIYDYGTDNTYVGATAWQTGSEYIIPESYNNHYIKIVFNAATQPSSYVLTTIELFTSVKIGKETNKINNFEKLTEMLDIAGSGENLVYTKTPQYFGYDKFIIEMHSPLYIENGSYTYTNGNKNNAVDGLRSDKYKLDGNITIVNNDTSHYRIRVFYWNSDGTYDGYIGWSSAPELNVTIDTTKFYAIGINTQTSGETINKEDALNNIGVFYSDDKLDLSNKTSIISSYIDSGAHQGGMFNNIPQNTLEAFNQTYQYGFDSVEFDVWWTSDRVPVISHDGTRTTVDSQVVTIQDVTYEQLTSYQFYSDPSIKIPKLFDVLKMCQIHHYKINIEIKTYEFSDQELQDIINYIDSLGYKNEDVLYNSVHVSTLLRCRNLKPGCNVTLALGNVPTKDDLINSPTYSNLRTLLSQSGHTWLSLNKNNLTTSSVLKDYKDLGYFVLIFYDGSSTSALLPYLKYTDAILTNYFTMADIIKQNDIMTIF